MISARVTRNLDRNTTVVAVSGELTPAARQELVEAVGKCLAECPLAVIVDLTGVGAIDRQGLSALLMLHHRAIREPSVALMLVSADDGQRRLLMRSATTRWMPIYQTVAQAYAAVAIAWTGQWVQLDLSTVEHPGERARRLVDETCTAWSLPHLVNAARLVVTELVHNAERHAGGVVEVSILMRGHFLYLGVRDRTPTPPVLLGSAHQTEDRGHGLWLVVDQCAAWGSQVTDTGKLVWATVDLRRSPRL